MMLRTNLAFFNFITELYKKQPRKEDIVLKHYSKGQKLFLQQEVPTKVMIIHEGIAKCYFTEENEKEYLLEFLGTGEVLGEIELIRNTPSLCTVEAITDVVVYACTIPLLRTFLNADISFNHLLLDVTTQRLMNTSSRASFQQLNTIEQNLSQLLKIQSDQAINLSKGDMAAYLGISVRSLNRSLKKLAGNGC